MPADLSADLPWPPNVRDILQTLQLERPAPERVLILRGRHLIDEGADTTSIYVHLSGWASVESDSRRGDRVLTDFFLAGDVAGLTDVHGASHYTVTALTDVTAVKLDRSVVLHLLEADAAFRAFCMHALRAQLDRTRNSRLALSAKTGVARVARILADLADRVDGRVNGEQAPVHLPLSQVLLSCAVDLTPVAVNRIVHTMRQTGAIDWDATGLRVLDRQRLRDLS
jgi:CRP-like cAMP-binding protein